MNLKIKFLSNCNFLKEIRLKVILIHISELTLTNCWTLHWNYIAWNFLTRIVTSGKKIIFSLSKSSENQIFTEKKIIIKIFRFKNKKWRKLLLNISLCNQRTFISSNVLPSDCFSLPLKQNLKNIMSHCALYKMPCKTCFKRIKKKMFALNFVEN